LYHSTYVKEVLPQVKEVLIMLNTSINIWKCWGDRKV